MKAHIDNSMEKQIEAGFIGIYACMHTVHDLFACWLLVGVKEWERKIGGSYDLGFRVYGCLT